jgi:Rha family phage regulatory protein
MAENTVSQNTPAVKISTSISVEFVGEDTPAVLSTEIAVRFQKKHKHILDEIRRIQSITPKSFHGPNFRPMFVDVEIGNGATRKDPAFLLTRDGFSLLAMGFTGKNAIQWKLRYIEAFNALEAAVLDNARAATLAEGKTLALEEGRREGMAQGAREVLALSEERKAVLSSIVRYASLGLSQGEIAKLTDRGPENAGKYIDLGRKLGLLPEGKKLSARQLANLQAGRNARQSKGASHARV